ncbi:MAG: mechanosensitive ion channel family protein [Actinocrinis sp.]
MSAPLMPAFAAFAAAVHQPSPSPSSTDAPVTVNSVGNWFSVHGSLLISHGVQIAGIIIACVAIRMLTTRSINRLVRHAAKAAEGRTGRLLGNAGLVAGERTRQRTQAIGSVLRSLASAVIFVIGGLMIVSVLTIPIAPILASVSVVGVAIGLGAQNLITDFVSGIFMIFEDQYGVGDIVDLGLASGTVESVGLRVTRLRDVEGTVWHVRNGEVVRVGNMSQNWARTVLDIPVPHEQDLVKVQDVLREVAHGLWDDEDFNSMIIEEPEVWGVQDLTPEWVTVRVTMKTAPLEQWAVAREMRQRIMARFAHEGIDIAMPARVLWHKDFPQPTP